MGSSEQTEMESPYPVSYTHLEFAVPLSAFEAHGGVGTAAPGSFLLALRSAMTGGIIVDRTGWTVLRLSENEPDIFRGVPRLEVGHSNM